MGRYKEKDTTSLADLLIPPSTSSAEIEDTKTGEKGKGHGFAKEEARENAWKNLKSKGD